MNVFCRITFVFLLLNVGTTCLLAQTDQIYTKAAFDSLEYKAITDLTRRFYSKVDQAKFYLTVLKDSTGKFFVSLDTFEIQLLAGNLSETNLVTSNFLNNYIKIYTDIHRKLRSGEMVWRTGELAPFGNGSNHWCNCQDVPYDEPNPWMEIEIEIINLSDSSGEFYWRWGNVPPESDWGQFQYYFKVNKYEGTWKIDYLEGLNIDDFTRRNN